MSQRLQPAHSRTNDVLLYTEEGRAEIVWFVDFTDQHTKRLMAGEASAGERK